MAEYLHPGVYIEEIERGPRPIEGVPTSTAALLGEAERGSITPRLVTSYKDYQRWFGSVFNEQKFLPYAANGFFENGGPAAWVVRVDPSSSASWIVRDVSGAASFTISASSPGTWGNALTVGVAADPGGAAGSLYSGVLSGAATVSSGTVFTVPLSSTAGLRPGDPVVAVARPSGAATVAMKLWQQIDMTGNPLLLLSVFSTMVGVQFIGLGMLGELGARIYFELRKNRSYAIRRTFNVEPADEPPIEAFSMRRAA